jgi:orotidine-5'-phosphate decarboxylase
MQSKLIVALDVPSFQEAKAFTAKLVGVPCGVKVGLELFSAAGPEVVHYLRRCEHDIMLDLKLHDIPETVGRAVRNLVALDPTLLTIHAGGGRKMMEAAVAASGKALVLAVTVLTSLDDDDLREVSIYGSVSDVVVRRAKLAIAAGCHGVVASPQEAAAIREVAPPDFLIVTPGVRPAGAEHADQKRVTTPRGAISAGASMIVVGRPIRDAADPGAAARSIIEEISA